jgi:two-component system sensor histidine kinase KdpD
VLDNARKYAGAPEPVDIYLRSEGEWVVIAITDHGGGIPPGELDRIFEKFYRAGGADGRAPGTGLGLPIARGFLKAMGGTIRAESPAQRRGGTRFTIRLARRGGVQ